jgi:hypothetical protein
MSNVYVTATTQIDYHQALKALERLIEGREAARFSAWDVQRLEGLVTAAKEKLHEREYATLVNTVGSVCVK